MNRHDTMPAKEDRAAVFSVYRPTLVERLMEYYRKTGREVPELPRNGYETPYQRYRMTRP